MPTTQRKTRCWPGYEPVPGKKPNEQGSCRKKATSKSSAADRSAQARRKRELDRWQKQHPGSPRKAAQHLGARKRRRSSK
jgi:hypothetical protein